MGKLKRWHQDLASKAARLRSRRGEAARHAEQTGDPEQLRKRKAAANRVLTIVKAALNHAYNESRGGLTSDSAWRKVKPFRGVDAPKVRFLSGEEIHRLQNACELDFRVLVQGALHTGARYGELRRARVRDYLTDSQSLYIPKSKGGKERHVFLSDEAAAFFEVQIAGRVGDELLFRRREERVLPERGTFFEPWGESHQHRRMREACAVAEIKPAVSFHILRHTYASHYLMNGGSIPGLAQQLGHADTRMTMRHYGHLAQSWRAEEARRHGLRLLANPSRSTVTKLRRRSMTVPRGAPR